MKKNVFNSIKSHIENKDVDDKVRIGNKNILKGIIKNLDQIVEINEDILKYIIYSIIIILLIRHIIFK